jgi:2-polyprenyl-3-methyl-5-hydroxy-6-metoxy-1,4-benzoquinol methylase
LNTSRLRLFACTDDTPSRGQSDQNGERTRIFIRVRSWDAFYSQSFVTEFRRRLYLDAFGKEYPAEEASDGYITRSELRQIAEALQVGPGLRIADVGCGRGGPGQWLVHATGAALLGIDFSTIAVDHVRARAQRVGIATTYRVAHFATTGLDRASVDGAFSIDVIWAIPDKRAGLARSRSYPEVRRKVCLH